MSEKPKDYKLVLMPIIRNVLPDISEDIIGVQPMAAPVAQIMTLKYRYGDERSILKDAIKEIEKERAIERAKRKRLF